MGMSSLELLSVFSWLGPETASNIWEMLFVSQSLLMKTYFASQISSQPSRDHVWYHITNPGVSFSFSLQPDEKILSNNVNGLKKEQKSNFKGIMVNLL